MKWIFKGPGQKLSGEPYSCGRSLNLIKAHVGGQFSRENQAELLELSKISL